MKNQGTRMVSTMSPREADAMRAKLLRILIKNHLLAYLMEACVVTMVYIVIALFMRNIQLVWTVIVFLLYFSVRFTLYLKGLYKSWYKRWEI